MHVSYEKGSSVIHYELQRNDYSVPQQLVEFLAEDPTVYSDLCRIVLVLTILNNRCQRERVCDSVGYMSENIVRKVILNCYFLKFIQI